MRQESLVARIPRERLYWLMLALTCLVWLTSGLFDREPWKADEAYSMGIVFSTVEHGEWLVPTLAGEPFLEKPPLVYWMAAIAAHLLSPPLPLHVAARAANVVCSLLTFWLMFMASQLAVGRTAAWRGVLLLAACPAYLFASRYMTADLGQMPAAALVMVGLVRLQLQRRNAGVLLGLGSGMGLLAKGVLLPSVAGVTALIVIACWPRERWRWGASQLGWTLACFALTGLLWPVLLGVRSLPLLMTWLWDNNVGRFLGYNGLGPPNSRGETIGTLAAVLLPAWPLSLWFVRKHWGRLRADPLFGPMLFAAIWLVVLLVSSTARGIYGIPMLVPLCMMGCATLQNVSIRRLSARWHWMGRSGLGLLAAAALGVSIWRLWKGFSAEPGGFSLGLTLLAAGLAVSWLLAIARGVRAGPMLSGVAGITLLFAVTLVVFLPRADTRTGYRGVFSSMLPYVPQPHGCVSSFELGESERGMLEYYTRLVTRRIEVDAAAEGCPLRFEQQRDLSRTEGFGCPGMVVLWQGGRAEHPEEVFRLCARPRDSR